MDASAAATVLSTSRGTGASSRPSNSTSKTDRVPSVLDSDPGRGVVPLTQNEQICIRCKMANENDPRINLSLSRSILLSLNTASGMYF